jgi:MFS family permease
MTPPDSTPPTSSTAASARPADFRLPTLIKRNMALFALSLSFSGIGMQFAFSIGPLMVLTLTGSASLAGLFIGALGLSRFLVSYSVGKITDTYGRKPGIFLGLVLGLAGAIIIGASVDVHSFALLAAGMLIFGMGMSAAQQLRVAATDMVPAHHRAQALGYVGLGAVASLLISPWVISGAEMLAPRLGQNAMALPWYLLPILIVIGMVLIAFVRPDPKEIGMNLARYYPGYVVPQPRRGPATFHSSLLWRQPRLCLATVANCAAQGNMSIVMVLTSLVLHEHGHSLSAIVFSHMFHSLGMWAFTIPLGKLSDRFGHERVMIPGLATGLIGAAMVAFTPAYLTVTVGTFLVGIGWAAANVAATAIVADQFETHERGRAIGVSDSLAGGISVAMALVTGPLLQWTGLWATGWVAVLVAIPPLFLAGVQFFARRPAVVTAPAPDPTL